VKKRITSHRQLGVWQRAFAASMQLFELSKAFPREERYSLIDQIRRSSRSVTACITEAWRKRRYEAAFVSKLNDAEGEAAETQDWIHYAVACGYVDRAPARVLFKDYDRILGTLVGVIRNADTWVFPVSPKAARDRSPANT
jgi:four helix bundle protein